MSCGVCNAMVISSKGSRLTSEESRLFREIKELVVEEWPMLLLHYH